jgi:hypothetical protein
MRHSLGFAALTAALGLAWFARAADAPAIAISHDGDAYSALVARAEADDATVDFRQLRLAWLDSAARKRRASTQEMTRTMVQAAQAGEVDKAATAARAILAIDYTDMGAHKYLRQSCAMKGDDPCALHEHFVEFRLLNSIIGTGDGKSPPTAWKVTSIDEEYFIMSMIGARLQLQSLAAQDGRMFDKMDVTNAAGVKATLWFDITDFFSKELD